MNSNVNVNTKNFFKLLDDSHVSPSWTWEEALCVIVTSPVYRTLTMTERKKAFEQWIENKKLEEKGNRIKKYENDREKLRRLFSTRDDITSSTPFQSVAHALASDSLFRSTNEDFRSKIYLEYINELKKREKDTSREARKEQLQKLKDLLSKLNISLQTGWKNAKEMFQSQPVFATWNHLDSVDSLLAFEDHCNALENMFYKNLDRKMLLIKRAERKNRQAFRECLSLYVSQGKIKAYTKWKDVKNDLLAESSLLNMLGQAGSTPLELFRDVILDLQKSISSDCKQIMAIYKKSGQDLEKNTNFEEFQDLIMKFSNSDMEIDNRQKPGPSFSIDALRVVFEDIKDMLICQERDDKRRQEKKLKRKMDAFKSLLKSLDPPITLKTKWEEAAAKISHKSDYIELPEDKRILCFQKYLDKLSGKESKDSEYDSEEKRRKKKKHSRRHRSESPTSSNEERKMKKKRSHYEEEEEERRSGHRGERRDTYRESGRERRDYYRESEKRDEYRDSNKRDEYRESDRRRANERDLIRDKRSDIETRQAMDVDRMSNASTEDGELKV